MRSTARSLSTYRCGVCGGRLPKDRYIYSRFTGSRFHWPGECRKYRRTRPTTTTEGGQS